MKTPVPLGPITAKTGRETHPAVGPEGRFPLPPACSHTTNTAQELGLHEATGCRGGKTKSLWRDASSRITLFLKSMARSQIPTSLLVRCDPVPKSFHGKRERKRCRCASRQPRSSTPRNAPPLSFSFWLTGRKVKTGGHRGSHTLDSRASLGLGPRKTSMKQSLCSLGCLT